jgi:N-acetylmuramoyl-L-alanine amidase
LRQRNLWPALAVFAVLGAIAPAAGARARHTDSWAREHFAAVERMREGLNGMPPAERTRRDYQRVLNGYRAVYNGAPTSSKADPSVVAVAEILVEMGRRFDDDKILLEAVDQYKFLRREYPGSKYRCQALFTIGEIYQDDLDNPVAARAAFREFLHRYPHNRLADDARQAIADKQEKANKNEPAANLGGQGTSTKSKSREESAAAEDRSGSELERNQKHPENDDAADADDDAADDQAAKDGPVPVRLNTLPRVTSIRHWSTPGYTRVAIDVESDVKFSSQRIGTPPRIYFDLEDTRLASTLVGKTFDVDDSFLKKIRVAQFAPRRTRVVLEVENLSAYDAFLLPNPARLIIDIHGRDIHGKNTAVGLPKAPNQSGEAAKSAPTETSLGTESGPSPSAAPNAPSDPGPDRKAEAETAGLEPQSLTPAAAHSSVTRVMQNGIVKTIVDDEDEDEAGAATPVPSKRNARILKSVASSPAGDDSEGHSDSSAQALDASAGSDPGASGESVASRALSASASGAGDFGVREAVPTANGDRSLIRALGLKIGKIVIDPGHGGHDTGTIGPNGLEEKDLVLDVGRRLGRLLETRLGAQVVYTRKDDIFVPLETRTAIANQARADLFISIHANSSHDEAARGVETYYLNFTSSPDALEVAARENAVSEASIYELQDLVKKIALKEKIEESREFACDVQESLHSGLATKFPAIRDRGVKKAPFIVLIGANMPSILAEISFVSNPNDERRLSTSEYRERIAEYLYRGIAKYANGLGGVKIVSKMDKTTGQ